MRALRIERSECQVLVQDLGRPGWAHLGVPPSGALDTGSLALANRLVGNPEGAAGLEILVGGLVMVAEGSTRVALTGAGLPLLVDGRAAGWGVAVSVPAGGRLEIGRSPGSLRAWLAVAGGLDVPLVLGSRSTDTLSGLGPEPVRAGDRWPVGPPPTAPEGPASAVPDPMCDGPVTLRLHLGPRDDWFTRSPLDVWRSSDLVVTPSSDRVALRLDGDPLVRRRANELPDELPRELPSEGLVTGAVQVPGDGRPLIFLSDRPTTGGYPVVGVVAAADLARCAQLRPGDRLRFRPAR